MKALEISKTQAELLDSFKAFLSSIISEIKSDILFCKEHTECSHSISVLNDLLSIYNDILNSLVGFNRPVDIVFKLFSNRQRDLTKSILNKELKRNCEMIKLRSDWYYLNYMFLKPCLIM